jgi:drug/metabolite transporter (DMT)-like permease
VVLLSPRLLGERPSRAELATIPIYAVGLLCFFLDDLSPGQRLGNWLALAAGLAFATCIVGLRLVQERGPSALVYGNWLAALATAPLWVMDPTPAVGDLLVLLYLGVFQLGLAYLCFARGVARTPALEASLLVLLEPVLNPIWTFLIAGERPGQWAIVGGGIVLLATLWRTLSPLWAKRASTTVPLS